MEIRKAARKDIGEIAKLMIDEFSKPPFSEKANVKNVLKSLNFYFKLGRIDVALIGKKIVGVVVFKVEQYWEGPVIMSRTLDKTPSFRMELCS